MPRRAQIFELVPGLLFDVRIEGGRELSWLTADDVDALIAREHLVPWQPSAEGLEPNMGGEQAGPDWFLGS